MTTRLAGLLILPLALACPAAYGQVYTGYGLGNYAGSPLGGAYPGVYGVNFGSVGFGAVGFPYAGYVPGGGYGYGYGGYGIGGYGFGSGYGYGGYGYGGFGYGMGMSLADQYMMKYQQYSLNSARYNLMNAKAATAYQAANLMQQKALQTQLENYSGGKYFEDGKSAPNGSGGYGSGGGSGASRDAAGGIPLDKLVARDGNVLWPLGAPEDGDLKSLKESAGAAVQAAMEDYLRDGRISVRNVVEARRKLSDYAFPAAKQIKQNRPEDYDDWVNWVSSLDQGLRTLASPAVRDQAGPRPAPAEAVHGDTKPEDAPKSAGDVLKGSLGNTPDGSTKPETATPATPKSEGTDRNPK